MLKGFATKLPFIRSPRFKRRAGIAALIVLSLLGVLNFALPALLKHWLVDTLAEATQRQVSLESVRIHYFDRALELRTLRVSDRNDGALLAGLDRLQVGVELTSLWRGAPVITGLHLERPQVHLVRITADRSNVSDLIDAFLAKPAGPTPKFALNDLEVQNGEVSFDDKVAGQKHVLSALNVLLPKLSSLPQARDIPVEPSLSAQLDGVALALKGESLPFAEKGESRFVLDLQPLDLVRYWGYLRAHLPPSIPLELKAGQLAGRVELTLARNADQPLRLSAGGAVRLSGVKLQQTDGSAFAALDELQLDLDRADFSSQQFVVRSLALRGLVFAEPGQSLGALKFSGIKADVARRDLAIAAAELGPAQGHIQRLANGRWVWLAALDAWFPAKPSAVLSAAPPAASSGVAPWIARLETLSLSEAKIVFDDASRHPAARQELNIDSLSAEKLSTVPGEAATLQANLRINQDGKLAVQGSLQAQPATASLELDASSVAILPMQAYFADQLRITVKDGKLAAKGKLDLAQAAGGAIRGRYAGSLTVGDFRSVEGEKAQDFVRWKSLHFNAIDAQLNPPEVRIGDIALSDFYARIVINPKGKLNLLQILRPAVGEADAAEAKPLAASETQPATNLEKSSGSAQVKLDPTEHKLPFPLEIERISLQGGTISFRDQFIQPNYSAQLMQLGGKINGVSSRPDRITEVDLRGSYENLAPISIAGTLTPFAQKPKLDIKADVRGVEMTTLSPYSARYVGYEIEKGKLSLAVQYKVEDQLLTAENRIMLNQLTFGARVESPDATSLPVTLAVALLKNSKGEIEINLPVSGSLDDPQFNIGSLIAKVFGNLFVKIVTAPFAFLGSLFGGGSEELSWVDFAPGRNALTPESIKRLEVLTKALKERPALRLEVRGEVNADEDREALKTVQLERKIKRRKLAENKSAAADQPLDEVVVEAGEYPALLFKVYRDEGFPKPRDILGLLKTLPVEEMEKLILTHTPISEESLRSLANRRAQRVRDWLVNTAGVQTDRVFLRSPRLEKEAGDKTAPTHRVEFSLR